MPLTHAEIQERTSLPFWYPKIHGHVPTPETRWVQTDIDLFTLLDGDSPDGFDVFLKTLDEAVMMVGGYPSFLRTGLISGKHDWSSTCFVSQSHNLGYHVARLVEASAMADLLGLPADVWVARELLHTKPAFYAFWGRMPITKERRYFVRDGRILGWQPYWPGYLPRVARVVEPSALVEEFLASCGALSATDLASAHRGRSPAVRDWDQWTKLGFTSSDNLANLYQQLGLSSLDAKKGQQSLRYLGSVVARAIPVEQRFAVGRRRGDLFDTAAEGRAQQVDALTLDLLDLDVAPVGDAGGFARGLLPGSTMDGEAAIGIEEARQVSKSDGRTIHFVSLQDGLADAITVAVIHGPNSIEKPDVPDWQDKLDQIQTADDNERAVLTALSLKVGELIEGCWSVDWLWVEDRGWVLTDMAVGEASFVWEGWPTAPDPEELVES